MLICRRTRSAIKEPAVRVAIAAELGIGDAVERLRENLLLVGAGLLFSRGGMDVIGRRLRARTSHDGTRHPETCRADRAHGFAT